MRGRVILKGSSRAFLVGLRRTLEDCGFETVIEQKDAPREDAQGVFIYEVGDEKDLLPLQKASSPFLVFSGVPISDDGFARLKEKGLAGVITDKAAPEDIASLVNRALFYNRSVKRNLRASVNIPVELKSGAKTFKTFSSALSRDGIFVVTLNPLPADSECDLSFTLPEAGREFKTRARVIYNISINKDLNIIASPEDPFKRLVTHPGMAVYFLDMPEEDRELIDRYIRTLR